MTTDEVIEEFRLHGIDATEMAADELEYKFIKMRLAKFRVIIRNNVARQMEEDQEERPSEDDDTD